MPSDLLPPASFIFGAFLGGVVVSIFVGLLQRAIGLSH